MAYFSCTYNISIHYRANIFHRWCELCNVMMQTVWHVAICKYCFYWDLANMYEFKKMQYVESISVFILKGIMSFLQKMRENTQQIAVLSSKRNFVGRFLLIFSICVSGYIARSTMIHCCNFENDCQDHYSSIKLTHFESSSTLSSFFKTNNAQVTYNTTGRK